MLRRSQPGRNISIPAGRMNVALVILHADPARGGAERYTIDLGEALVRRGHHVSLLATSFAHVPAGVAPVMLAANALTRVGAYNRMIGSFEAHVSRVRYDVVHAMLPLPRCDVYHPHAGLAVASVRSAPFQALLNPRRLRFSAVEQSLLKSDCPPIVLCLSQYVRSTIQRHYQLDEQRLPVLFNAVDLDRFDPNVVTQPARPNQVVALMVAQDFARKGLRKHRGVVAGSRSAAGA